MCNTREIRPLKIKRLSQQCKTQHSLAMLIFLLIALVGGKITILEARMSLLDATDECDLFHYGDLCTLYPASNIVDMFPDLSSEVEC